MRKIYVDPPTMETKIVSVIIGPIWQTEPKSDSKHIKPGKKQSLAVKYSKGFLIVHQSNQKRSLFDISWNKIYIYREDIL